MILANIKYVLKHQKNIQIRHKHLSLLSFSSADPYESELKEITSIDVTNEQGKLFFFQLDIYTFIIQKKYENK